MPDRIEILGPGGRLRVIPVQELDAWKRHGYVPVEEAHTSSAGTISIESAHEFNGVDKSEE
jgi:hypothetical protein